jgi:hypothetical protein
VGDAAVSPIVLTEEEAAALSPAVTAAVNTLAAKEKQLRGKAVRCRVGSNARKGALATAEHIRSCGRLLITQPTYHDKLYNDGLLEAAWKPICQRIAQIWSAEEQRREAQRNLEKSVATAGKL